MLYLGSAAPSPECDTPDLCIQPIKDSRVKVKQWFAHSAVQFVGAHTGCSCGFPSIWAAEPMAYFDGMWNDREDRTDDLRSVRALLELIRVGLDRGESVELYPVWDGDEGKAPCGCIEWNLAQLSAETFVFNQGFMHMVRRTHSH